MAGSDTNTTYVIVDKDDLVAMADSVREATDSEETFDVGGLKDALIAAIEAGSGGGTTAPFVSIDYGTYTPAENTYEFALETHVYRTGHFFASIANTNGITRENKSIEIAASNGNGWVSNIVSYKNGTSTNGIHDKPLGGGYISDYYHFQAGITYAFVYYRLV